MGHRVSMYPGSVLSTLHILMHLITTTTLVREVLPLSQFTEEEMEA